MKSKLLNYFGYGSNRDIEMMGAIIGRKQIDGVPGKLLGFDLCIQKINDIPDKILTTAPTNTSPREILSKTFDNNFELYIIKPKEGGVAYGTIWKITEEENNLVRDWELLEYGMQEDINAVAMDSKGRIINVVTHGLLSVNAPINRVITGDNYENYIVSKEDILKAAEKDYKAYIENKKH